ncbi:MAG: sugar ABC transporter ATP-binding protein [Actinobacteria bacterium]|nr:sugar ABC transporter ATP-binding protein [Actinomycetota bacterium]
MTFGSNRVLRDVSLEVRPGELHGLIGQNGSGKSTLAKVLSGLYAPDPGARIAVDGEALRLPVRPLRSRAAGVAVVHQSLGLIPQMTVLENMRMGRLKARGLGRRIDWNAERVEAEAVFERLGRRIDPGAKVADLREEDGATVAIARALQDATPGRGLIIFDESSRALGRRALEHFFGILDEIVATGTSVLLITHRLEEIVDAADRVTVLRDGRVVEAGRPVAGLSEADITSLMLGRTLDLERRSAPRLDPQAAPVAVRGLSGRDVRDASFDIRRGEVVGVTGLAGSGYDDIPYLLSGATRADAGTLTVRDGALALDGLTPGSAIDEGVALVPEGRETAGLAMTMSMSENIMFPTTARGGGRARAISHRREAEVVRGWIDALDVRPQQPDTLVKNLSGGNQQKVLLAKWLQGAPDLLVMHEPTQAVDVGARATLVRAIRAAAAEGRGVLVSGSDENELALLCDRVLVFAGGEVAAELTGELTPDGIVEATYSRGRRARLRQRESGGVGSATEDSGNEHEERP